MNRTRNSELGIYNYQFARGETERFTRRTARTLNDCLLGKMHFRVEQIDGAIGIDAPTDGIRALDLGPRCGIDRLHRLGKEEGLKFADADSSRRIEREYAPLANLVHKENALTVGNFALMKTV